MCKCQAAHHVAAIYHRASQACCASGTTPVQRITRSVASGAAVRAWRSASSQSIRRDLTTSTGVVRCQVACDVRRCGDIISLYSSVKRQRSKQSEAAAAAAANIAAELISLSGDAMALRDNHRSIDLCKINQ
eukprot:COSAG01_NODE_5434_length_4265_cov_2.657945_2_plen_132_part_00